MYVLVSSELDGREVDKGPNTKKAVGEGVGILPHFGGS